MQQSRVVGEMRKIQVQKACELALDDGLDLEQIYEDQDSGFFINSSMTEYTSRVRQIKADLKTVEYVMTNDMLAIALLMVFHQTLATSKKSMTACVQPNMIHAN